MSEIDVLIHNYSRFVALPWPGNIAAAQRVWFVIYDPPQERRLRLQIDSFRIATEKAGHTWRLVDLTDSFAHWMADHRYREAYFESPEDLGLGLKNYTNAVIQLLHAELTAPDVDADTVVAVSGLASLFGLTKASEIIEKIAPDIPGRLLVFFPGRLAGDGNYRLLNARDGWSYLAIPITA